MEESIGNIVLQEEGQSNSTNLENKMDTMWSSNIAVPTVLNPDDSLMAKFQSTLRTHLLRVDNKLAEDIHYLETMTKQAEKQLELDGIQLYQVQQQVESQYKTIEQCREALTTIVSLREKKDLGTVEAKEIHKKMRTKLETEKNKRGKLFQNLKKLLAVQNRFSKLEENLSDYLIISKQMSLHDATKQKELVNAKQRSDYIFSQLEENIWKVETEIAYLDEQLQIKSREKEDVNQMVIDTNTDLEALHKEHKDLYNIWHSAVANICKRNNYRNQLQLEREEACKSYDKIQLEIDKIRKEINSEIETNEYLTSVSFRTEHNNQIMSKIIEADNEKVVNIESQLIKLLKLGELAENEYNSLFIKYQNCLYEEGQINIELKNIASKKNNCEEMILTKLENKIICDKTAQYTNELLINSKKAAMEYEFLLAHVENLYGNNLLKLEKLRNIITDEKMELQEIVQKNTEKELQIDGLKKEITRYETTIGRKQTKLLATHKLVEQIVSNIGGEALNPQDLKLVSLDKNIREIQQTIWTAQQNWIRQQGFMVSLSQERDLQLQELNLLNKEIMIIEQKNLKLQYAIETFGKEEVNANKMLTLLEQKISHMNADLAAQKYLKTELEDKGYIMKNECIFAFHKLESDLVKLQSDIKTLHNDMGILKEELHTLQQESLSWEKKVKITQETINKLKEERNAGSILLMKNEIHKMEMRLSHLRRLQEKLIHDMEFCVSRRDVMVDKMLVKSKTSTKNRHNQKVIVSKRLSDQRAKIKHLTSCMKKIESKIQEMVQQMKTVQSKLTDCQEMLNDLGKDVLNMQQEIERLEILKCHNLQRLVFKQRKTKLLCDIKNNKYKMIFKSDNIIEENLQNERSYRQYLKCVMEKTDHDFPSFKNDICKILLTLQIL